MELYKDRLEEDQIFTELKSGYQITAESFTSYETDTKIKLNDSIKTSLISDSIFECQLCSKTFTKTKYLKKHLKLHTKEKNYKCHKCDRAYTRSDHLKRHQVTHSEDTKPFRCDLCIQRFSNRSHLKRHIKIIHLGEIDKFEYKCEKCEATFNKKYKLNKHVSIIHKEEKKITKKYECYYTFCPRAFHSKGKLDMHLGKAHSNNNNLGKNSATKKIILQCPFEDCYKTYTTSYNLKVHVKTFHYGVEEFICEFEGCVQTFKHKCSLERHQEKFHLVNKMILAYDEMRDYDFIQV